MYQLSSAIGILKVQGSRWNNIDIGTIPMIELYMDYKTIYAKLSSPFYTGTKTLNLEDIKSQYIASTLTFNEMLAALGDQSLPTTDISYSFETKKILYSDAFRARYKIEPISPLASIDSSLPMSEREWLSLTKNGIDYNLFYRSCLVSVNGFFHLTDTNGERVFVVDGMKTCRYSGNNQIGITSFRQLGSMEYIPITESMIYKQSADQPYADKMFIDIGMDKSNKYAMLVLGGYLHILDTDVFTQVGNTTYCINFKNINIKDRYFESKDVIDLSSLGLDRTPKNENQISLAQLLSDSVLTKYATLTQSFIVFIDNPNIFKEYEHLPRTVIPNVYVSHIEPTYPLITCTGKLSDYWKTPEDKKWSVTTANAIRHNYNFNTTDINNLSNIDNKSEPFNRVEFSRARYLVIGTDILISSGA